MVLKQLLSLYSRLKIRAKITVPFVVSFTILWLSGTSFLGYYSSRKLRIEQTERLEGLTVLVAENFEQELFQLKSSQNSVNELRLQKQLSSQLLSKVAEKLEVELVALSEDTVVAHSFADVSAADLENVQPNNPATIKIGKNRYFQASLPLESANGEQVTILVLRDRATFAASLLTIRTTVGGISLLGIGIAAFVGYWVGDRIARPIRGLAEAANQVSQEANFGVRVAAVTQDELGTLARSLNQLIEWSGYYTHELELAAQTLDQRVQERTQELESAVQELKETQLQLIQTEKMSSLGQMVAGIAHEINNPVGFIQGNAFHLRGYFDDLCNLVQKYQVSYTPTPAIAETIEDIDLEFLLEDTHKVINSIEIGSKRVKDIVIALRNFSRLDESAIKDVDIHEGLESTLLILHHRLNQNVEVAKAYGELPLVRCYPAQLNQVFTNIVANAIDAMDEVNCEPKKLTITTRAIADGQVQVSFRDTGAGITAKMKQKIFDPFFTTKAVGKGTGLGLGICYQIIQKHFGHIEVVSEAGQGAEFIVTLPICVLSES
ncbi:MAG: ATP-binding protein [Cyanobacteria bacterium J06635_15]